MSMAPLGGIPASAAGTSLAQTKGPDVERAQNEVGGQQRRVQSQVKAEAAGGIGETDGEDHEAAERDADGRRLWEPAAKPDDAESEEKPAAESAHEVLSKDASGQSGNQLDLSG